jgi:dihydrolipoamide dehydrogenase
MKVPNHFDLIVIGGGPAGYAGAMRALDFKKSVLLIEKKKLGGAAIYEGVLWSKSLWEYSQKVYMLRKEIPNYAASFDTMHKIVDEAMFERKTQVTVHVKLLENTTNERLFYYEKGTATLVDKNTIELHKEHNGETELKKITADKILIATGSRPRYLPNIPIDEKIIMTSSGLSNITAFPKSLVILGAGVVGCEFATIFSNLGTTKVFLIDKADRILPFEDADVAEIVTQSLEENGATIHKNASLLRMEIKDGEVEYELQYKDGSTEVFRVEKALVSVGRVPNVENLGLEKVSIKLNEKGSIWDDDTQTNIANIYAAGDVTTEIALVNVGEREARHAIVRMFGPAVKPMSYKNISSIMFLNPEVATVGLSEQECVSKGIPVKVVKLDYSTIARAIAMRKTKGFFKIIVTNDNAMRIVGMRAVGEHASSAIQAIAYLISTNQGIQDLADMIHPHPSIIEGIQECLRMLLGKSIYKSSIFKDKLKAYSCENGICTPLEKL